MCTPDFYRETNHVCQGRSPKARRCCHCSGEIVKGDHYVDISGRWDGDFLTYRAHAVCHELFIACTSRWQGDPDEGPSLEGGLVEEALEEANANRGSAPDYWPEGVPVSGQCLRDHVAKLRAAA